MTKDATIPRKRRLIRILLWMVLIVASLPVLAVLLFQTAPVQNYVRVKATDFLRNKFHTHFSIGQIKLSWWNSVLLKKVYLADTHNQPLLYSGSLEAHFNLLSLLQNKLVVHRLDWKDVMLNVYRLPGDTAYNYQFIVTAFSSTEPNKDTVAGKPLVFSIGSISLKNFHLRFKDEAEGSNMTATWKNLSIDPEKIAPDEGVYAVEKLSINEGHYSYQRGKVSLNPDSTLTTGWWIKNLDIRDASFNAQQTTVTADAITLNLPRGLLEQGKKPSGLQKQATDFNQLHLTGIGLNATDIYYAADSMQVHLKELALKEGSGFAVEKGQGELLYTDKTIAAKNLLLQTHKSRIASEKILLQTPSFAAFSSDSTLLRNNPSLLKAEAEFSNSYLDMPELATLLTDLAENPSLRPIFRKRIQIDGALSGTMALLQLNGLNISDNDGTELSVSGTISNATDPGRMLAVLQQINVRSGNHSIRSWLPAGTIPDSISLPDRLHLQGSASYSRYAVQAALRLNSTMGNIVVNGKASDYMDQHKSRYTVQVPLLEMDLGRLLMDTALGPVNLSFSAEGQGYDYKTLSAKADLNVKEAFYNGYRYHAIRSQADLKAGDYALSLVSKDSNALASVDLSGRLDSLKSRIKGNLDLQKLDFYATHWSASPLRAKAAVVVDMTDLQPRQLNGDLIVSGIQLADDSALYVLDSIHLVAKDSLERQWITLNSPFGYLSANGDFDYTTAFTDLAHLFLQHLQPATGDAALTDSTGFFTKKGTTQGSNSGQSQQMDLQGELQWPGSLKRLAPSLQMNQPLRIQGHLNTDSSLAALSFQVADLGYQDFRLDTLRGKIETNSSRMAGNITLSRLLHPQFPLERTTLQMQAASGHLETDITLLDKAKRTKYAIGSAIRFLPENTLWFSLKPQLILNRDEWQVSDSNKIVLQNGDVRSGSLTISQGGQLISLHTTPDAGTSTGVKARIENFRLETLSALLEKDSLFAEGIVNGEATLTDIEKQAEINARLKIDSFRMMNTAIGNLTAEMATTSPGEYKIDAGLTGNGNDVAIKGNYGKNLSFDVDLNRLNMGALEPLTMGAVQRMSGVTTGQLSLKGATDAPQIRGTLVFDSVAAVVSALGSYLKLPHNELVFEEKGIRLNNFIIEDSLNNRAEINGQVLTTDYTRFRFQLDLLADHFMAIGPKVSGEQMIYGPSFVDAEAKITGTNLRPRIDLKLALRDSSNFTIVLPEAEPGIAEREGVIVFVDKDNQQDSSLLRLQDTVAIRTPPAFQGLALTAQIEFTPKSTIRVVVDQQNGDYLEVKGKANLDAVLSPTADPSITGRYEIDEGSYNLSLNNLIKRKFTIEKGSTITLPGNVTQAVVDITARYRVEAVAGDLVEDQLTGASDTKKTQFRQKVPVDVYLLIKDEILKPDISFRLDMPEKDRNVLNGVIYSRIKQINQVESELNKQVMGLLVLNSFIPENPLALLNDRGGGVEGTARKSVSKLISQQLNNFAGSVIKGFDVNFDLESGEDYSTGKVENRTDLSIGISKSLFNDRVSVSVGSSVNLEGPQQAQEASTLVGDVSVDYKITPDGRYRIRAYRQNETDAIVEGQIVETGASFIYTVDYNEFRELFHRIIKKDKKRQIKKKKKQESP